MFFCLKTGSEPTGEAREDLPTYKLDLPDPIFGVPVLKRGNLRPQNLKHVFLGGPEKSLKDPFSRPFKMPGAPQETNEQELEASEADSSSLEDSKQQQTWHVEKLTGSLEGREE